MIIIAIKTLDFFVNSNMYNVCKVQYPNKFIVTDNYEIYYVQ